MPKNRQHALAELEQRWREIFLTLQRGGEVPPSTRLRAEGFMEATVAMQLCSAAALQDAMEQCYSDCFESELPADWRELFPFPQVPGFGRRAPVIPSTAD